MLKDRDFLLHPAVVDGEIGLLERTHQRPLAVLHSEQEADQFDVNLERALREQSCGGESQCGGDYDRALITDSSHSPSTQTSPSAKYSFFQIGTSRLSRLMPSSAASNAALRCGAAATTTTLASPISRRPKRWIMPIRPIGSACAISQPI